MASGHFPVTLCLLDYQDHVSFKDEEQDENINGISRNLSFSQIGEFAIILAGYAMSTGRHRRTFQGNTLLKICRKCQSNKSGLLGS
jgi:hypothetical protein